MAPLIDIVPAPFLAGARAAANALGKMDRVLIAAHVNPDGDAVGAMSACGWILNSLGRKFALYSPSPLPTSLEFLNLPGPIHPFLAALPFEPESALYLDCSEASRLGRELEACWNNWPTLNIDHHLCEHGLGSLANFINPAAAATCQLVAYISCCLDLPLTGNLAQGIATGLLTDTGNFTHNNASADVFALCAALERGGCSLPAIGEELLSDWRLNRMHLWGRLFQETRQVNENRVAWVFISAELLRETHCKSEDLERLIDFLSRLAGVQVALTVRELEPVHMAPEDQTYKFSLRSKGAINVQQAASALGGGGHRNAAGGTIMGRRDAVMEKLFSAIDSVLAG